MRDGWLLRVPPPGGEALPDSPSNSSRLTASDRAEAHQGVGLILLPKERLVLGAEEGRPPI